MQKLILGTVQMGLDYGVNNDTGKISMEKSHEILLKAFLSGVRTLDTAESYGNAHQVIGEFHRKFPDNIFKIVTKIPNSFYSDKISYKVNEYIDTLNVNYLDVLMFHSFDSFLNNSKYINLFLDLKAKGLIKHLGVSVYTNDQLEYLLHEDSITLVQLPFNLLDNISIKGELIKKLKDKNKILHTRSVFLQGLFFKKMSNENEVFQMLRPELKIINQITKDLNCSIEELALSYCLSQEAIDSVIIGVDSMEHLKANLDASLYEISKEIIDKINEIKIKDLNLLNPSLWK